MKKFCQESYDAINLLFTEDELAACDEEEQIEEARSRMIYNSEKWSINLVRVTDLKGNFRVILPKKVRNLKIKAKLELLRIKCLAVFK